MAKRKGSKSKSNGLSLDLEFLGQSQVVGSIMILIGIMTLLTLISPRQGTVTSWWIGQLRSLVGGGVVVLPFILVGFGLWGVLRGIGKLDELPWYRPVGGLLLFLAVVIALHMDRSISDADALQIGREGGGGGLLGYAGSEILINGLGYNLSWVVVILLGILGTALLMGPLLLSAADRIQFWLGGRTADWQALQEDGLDTAPSIASRQPDLPVAPLSFLDRLKAMVLGGTLDPGGAEPKGPALVIGGNGANNDSTPDPTRAPRVIGGDAPTATSNQTAAGQNRGSAPATADSLIPRIIGGGRSWRLPNVDDILDDAIEVEISKDEIRERAKIIEQTLSDFGVPVRVVEANQGPAVTQYGLQPGYRQRRRSRDEIRREAEEILKRRGYGSSRRPITDELVKEVIDNDVERYERVKIKVSKIQSLSNDLALALAASPIRIEAPVPGRPMVGLEVPNMQKTLVSLRGVMESDTFRQMKSPLKIALGQDTAGQPAIADLGRMPHLLIAGATGSGKSVCVNAIISTLLLTHTPDTLRLLMIDPKMVELTTYNGIPHLLSPVVVELERVVPLLRWATSEMDRRYKLFAKEGARNLEAYNAKMVKKGEPTLPYMVLIIDELADLMMAAPDDVERYVCRLAQMSRATGIHLIIATQRPSVDVVTGLIKANFPSRVAFAVTSQIDSRVILDTPGAEALLGKGDMLFMRPDSSKLARLQGCFVSDAELEKLVRYWKGVRITEGEDFQDEVVPMPGGMTAMPPPRPEDVVQMPIWEEMIQQQKKEDSQDDLYEEAVQVVRTAGRASVSLLQRRLRIGYSRAARLIDLLEERGVVGPDRGGSRGREVLPEPGEQQTASSGSSNGTETDGIPEESNEPTDDHPPRVWF
ncbi:MAG: DNA translocase FtsK [Chloroflexota bacterium]|nr:DNA translocase FtsK [Chloroflexota bacterium]